MACLFGLSGEGLFSLKERLLPVGMHQPNKLHNLCNNLSRDGDLGFTATGPEHFAVNHELVCTQKHPGVTCDMNATGRRTKAQHRLSNAVVESWSPVKTFLYIVMQNIWLRLLIKNERG